MPPVLFKPVASPSERGGRGWDVRFAFALLLPLGLLLQLAFNPSSAGLGALVTWVLIAGLDHFLPGGQTSPPPTGDSPWHMAVVRLYVPLQIGIMLYAAWLCVDASWPMLVGMAFAVGWMSGAQGITFAHELGHSRNKADRACGWLLMASVWYAHFMVEHYRGHHPRAATFEDPATSRLGENVYRFWLRTVCGSWASAWRLEAIRLTQMKRAWWQSALMLSFAANVALLLGLVAFGLWRVGLAWLLASFIAFTLLELVNYIEHYGLQRSSLGDKREPFNPMHAWNANHLITNALLANLQRHSDHHTNAWKPYPTLEHSPPPAPQLPTGYAGCLLLALVPPLWFRVMNPKVAAVKASLA